MKQIRENWTEMDKKGWKGKVALDKNSCSRGQRGSQRLFLNEIN